MLPVFTAAIGKIITLTNSFYKLFVNVMILLQSFYIAYPTWLDKWKRKPRGQIMSMWSQFSFITANLINYPVYFIFSLKLLLLCDMSQLISYNLGIIITL